MSEHMSKRVAVAVVAGVIVALAPRVAADIVPSNRVGAMDGSAFRTFCNKMVTTRLDPIVNPGEVSGHAHDIFGGLNFGALVSEQDLQNSETTCDITQDTSMYWAPSLYGRMDNGSLMLIPSRSVIYYDTPYVFNVPRHGVKQGDQLYAMPRGLRMVVGDATLRSGDGYIGNKQSMYKDDRSTWWRGHVRTDTGQKLGSEVYGTFPPFTTESGKRVTMYQADIIFPCCWDGVNLDSPDHISHMSYPIRTSRVCPDSHPYMVPEIRMEVVYFTGQLSRVNDKPLDPSDFILSTGDSSGASMHADVISGFDEGEMANLLRYCIGVGESNTGATGAPCPVDRTSLEYDTVYELDAALPEEEVQLVDTLPSGPATLRGAVQAVQVATAAGASAAVEKAELALLLVDLDTDAMAALLEDLQLSGNDLAELLVGAQGLANAEREMEALEAANNATG